MCECMNAALVNRLAKAAFIQNYDKVHSTLKYSAALKGLSLIPMLVTAAGDNHSGTEKSLSCLKL